MTQEEEKEIEILEMFSQQSHLRKHIVERNTTPIFWKALNNLTDKGILKYSRNQLTDEYSEYSLGRDAERYHLKLIEKGNQEQISEEKLKWDIKVSKFQAKSFWVALIIGFIGGLCGLISLIIELKK